MALQATARQPVYNGRDYTRTALIAALQETDVLKEQNYILATRLRALQQSGPNADIVAPESKAQALAKKEVDPCVEDLEFTLLARAAESAPSHKDLDAAKLAKQHSSYETKFKEQEKYRQNLTKNLSDAKAELSQLRTASQNGKARERELKTRLTDTQTQLTQEQRAHGDTKMLLEASTDSERNLNAMVAQLRRYCTLLQKSDEHARELLCKQTLDLIDLTALVEKQTRQFEAVEKLALEQNKMITRLQQLCDETSTERQQSVPKTNRANDPHKRTRSNTKHRVAILSPKNKLRKAATEGAIQYIAKSHWI